MALGPLPVVPGVVKTRYIYTWFSRPVINIMYLKGGSGSLLQGDVNSLATQVFASWNTNIKGQIASSMTLQQIEVTDLTTRTGPVSDAATTSAGSRTSTTPVPANVAMCVSLRTAYRFRGGHCRQYISGWNQADIVSATQWSGAVQTAAAAAWNAHLTALKAITLGGQSYKPVMLSYFSHDANGNLIYRPDGPQTYDIMNAVVRSRVDTQRRRLGKEVA